MTKPSSPSSENQIENKLVSIIMPAFNSAEFIEPAIQSVIDQRYAFWELLVAIDAGTVDNTAQIVQNLAAKDSRIRLIEIPKEKGRGLALSRNWAISLAEGRYLAFLDSDDLWLPDKLQVQISFMQSKNSSFSCTAFRRIDHSNTVLGRLIEVPRVISYRRLLQQNCIGCLTVVLDFKAIGKKIEFLETKHEDFILWLSLLKKGFICHGINMDLARYRIVSQSRSADKLESVRNTWRIYREVEKLNFPHALFRLSQFAVRNMAKYSRF